MNKIYSILVAGICLLSGAAAYAATPTITEVEKLIAADGAGADYFGYSVAVDGDTAVIGAYGDDDLGNESGAAYIYTRDAAGAWSQQQKLTASDGVADDRFGWVVAVEGDIAVVGRESYDYFTPPNGAAYVFTRDSAGVWTERQKLTAYDGFAGDRFGESLAMSGNTIVVGAKGDDDQGTYSGSVYVFTSDSAGAWSLQQKLIANQGASADWFGGALDIDGDTAVITASGYDFSPTIADSGIVYVFTRDGSGVWTEQQGLLPSDPASNLYGQSVAVNGDSVVIGASVDDQTGVNAGAAYVFTRDSTGAWNDQQKLTASDAAAGDYFGQSVDIEGTTLVIGAYGDDDNGTDAGSAYAFTRDSTGVWNEQVKLLASDGVDYDYLASATKAVGLSAGTVVAGARLADTAAGASVGSAYVFEIAPSADAPDIALSTSAVDFGEILVGQTAQDVVTLTNYGAMELTVSGISVASGVDFSQTHNCPAILQPAEACQITVSFSPTIEGALSDLLTVLSNDPDEPSVSVSLSGSGITQLPDLVVTNIASPDTLIANDYATINVTIANQGGADVTAGYYVYLYLGDSFLALDWVSAAPAAGMTKDLSWFVKIPRLPKGTYNLKAIVDTYDHILEGDETNNTLTKPVSVVPN